MSIEASNVTGLDYARRPGPRRAAAAPTLAHAALKRALDVALSLVLLAVASAGMILIAFAIRLVSGGPAIYRHRRVGRDGTGFDCLKFRTMVLDADAALAAHLARSPDARAEWEAGRKLRDDPRILGRLGRVLRQTSLDELPQLFNVLAGHMSLVGPRPVMHDELACYGRDLRWYLAVRPGVTGPWQVGGRSDTTYAERVGLDVDYARNPSLLRDLAILLRTARLVFSGRGAC